ncbi:hypothetical protein RVR_4414 [Actinacidiphila reveromycinica]|uniref:Uncharacterized protein n=1 Tax=Actinacidiphila reveromycinica TaxID=659352 RepID=A0A7U3UTD1_9ACTN|nr:hypothetical protein [Streptomyces sp. SN-593]BBA98283.1 hypothetical protein RVR_4414 [Streptomyces sp. SN-593]
MRLSTCADCRREVWWTVTDAGKRLAVDPEPNPDGNAAVYRDGTGTRRSRRPTDELPLMGWERLHMPHVVTCSARPRTPAPAPAPAGPLPPGVSDLSAYRRRRT